MPPQKRGGSSKKGAPKDKRHKGDGAAAAAAAASDDDTVGSDTTSISEPITPAERALIVLESSVHSVDSTIEKVEQQRKEAITECTRNFDLLRDAVNEKRKVVENEVTAESDRLKDALTEQKEALKKAIAEAKAEEGGGGGGAASSGPVGVPLSPVCSPILHVDLPASDLAKVKVEYSNVIPFSSDAMDGRVAPRN